MRQADNSLEIQAPQTLWEKVGQADIAALIIEGLTEFETLLERHPSEAAVEVVGYLYQQWGGSVQMRTGEFDDAVYCQIVVRAHEFAVAPGVLAGMYLALGVEQNQR